MPIWNGEWGPVYANASDGKNYEEINETRYAVLRTQLDIYHRAKASWSIWLYKDIGFQGMVYIDENTPYMKLLKPFLEKKKVCTSLGVRLSSRLKCFRQRLAADAWGCDDTPVRDLFAPLNKFMEDATNGSITERYPPMWRANKHISRLVRNCLMSEELCPEYASYFKDLSFDRLDEIAKSFSYENCKQRTRLNEYLMEDSKRGQA